MKAVHRMHRWGERTEDTALRVFDILANVNLVDPPPENTVRDVPLEAHLAPSRPWLSAFANRHRPEEVVGNRSWVSNVIGVTEPRNLVQPPSSNGTLQKRGLGLPANRPSAVCEHRVLHPSRQTRAS